MYKKLKATLIGCIVLGVITTASIYLSRQNIQVLHPAGPIAMKERNLLFVAVGLMLIIVLPVFYLTFSFAYKYRATNTKQLYTPNWDHSLRLEAAWWLIPTALIIVLGTITWNATHALDPYKQIASSTPPMLVQVVALDWKWLFIYPKQNVASVNYLAIPTNTPITFEITADAPMNSFWIPQLGGQMYAMPGMVTELNLLASKPGNYRGVSANISGSGFADMHFDTAATPMNSFEQWVNQVKQHAPSLTAPNYASLKLPTTNDKSTFYEATAPNLFSTILDSYNNGRPGMAGMSM